MSQAWNNGDLRALLNEFTSRKGALLEALHAVQNAYGFVPKETVPIIADEFNLSDADVHGVISFYHDFTDAPRGQHTIKICQAESCQSMGSRALTDHAKNALGVDFHETDSAGKYSLEPVYCLGNCACSPSIMIDDQVFGRVSKDRFDALIKKGA